MMKNILIIILSLISFNSFSQKKDESIQIIDSVSKVIKKHETFISWYVENDTVKITQFTTYDRVTKKYIHFNSEDIQKYYPTLNTTKIQFPLGGAHRSDVDNINRIQPIHFGYRPNFSTRRNTNR